MKSNLFLFVIGILLCGFASAAKDEAVVLTKDNHVIFSGVVNDRSVSDAQVKLGLLSAKLPVNSTIYLILDTPGGSVMAGNMFIDYVNALPQTVKPICIFCASMGYHMFQSFGERIAIPSSMLMSHRVQIGGMSGQVPGELISRLNSITDLTNRMDARVAARVGIKVADYQKQIYDELWLNGEAAVESNHADTLAKVRCSTDLINGTRTENIDTIFGAVEATFSACPLISGPVSLKVGAKGAYIPRNNAEVLREVKKAKRKVVMGVF